MFLSVFQIFPIAPFHIIDLGGSTFASGSGLLSAGGAYMTSFLPERRRAEGIGYKRIFIPCLVFIPIGLSLLALGGSRVWMVLSAIIFGVGFGTAYPVFVAYIMQRVDASRRGAAFGAMLAAFDTGIGTGSTMMGWLIQRMGFANAFGVAAGISAFALPYFFIAARRFGRRDESA